MALIRDTDVWRKCLGKLATVIKGMELAVRAMCRGARDEDRLDACYTNYAHIRIPFPHHLLVRLRLRLAVVGLVDAERVSPFTLNLISPFPLVSGPGAKHSFSPSVMRVIPKPLYVAYDYERFLL